jgi:Plant transposon protein
MRQDGILNGRFRILKLPLQYHTVDKIDSVFFTCCILHNMLHALDGLDEFKRDTVALIGRV